MSTTGREYLDVVDDRVWYRTDRAAQPGGPLHGVGCAAAQARFAHQHSARERLC